MTRVEPATPARAHGDPGGTQSELVSCRSLIPAKKIQHTNAQAPQVPSPDLARWLFRDPLLFGAFVVSALLFGFQIGVTLWQPAWIGPVTDWLRTVLAWPEFLVVVWVARLLSRTHHSAAWSWRMWGVALLFYAVAQSVWTLSAQFVFRNNVPVPALPILFYLLQYPCYFLAVILLPRTRFWGSRVILTLDTLLIMGAVVTFSWQFILAPLYAARGMSPLTRATSLAFPVGDLFVLLGLTITLLRAHRYGAVRLVVSVLVLAVSCLIIADSWAVWLDVRPPYVYRSGSPPDGFWLAFYLLIPLAGLCQVRLAQIAARLPRANVSHMRDHRSVQWHDFTASLRFFFPIVLALVACGAIMMNAAMNLAQLGWRRELVPLVMSSGLLLLILVRQELTFLEMAQLRRETEYARASEQAAVELNRRKDEFLNVISHELKTPLTSLQGYLELLALRFSTRLASATASGESDLDLAAAHTTICYAEDSLHRIALLVDELLDDSRIREGRLVLHLERCDLESIARKAVEEQRILTPGRAVLLEEPASGGVPVAADARRIGQVITNYLTNALKYSKEDRPVTVRMEVTGELARVSVHDEGVGVPFPEQAYVWERFHPITGNVVQSGSGVSLGIGLHICKSIIDAHRGQVGVESIPGCSSTFWFTLPLATARPDRANEEARGAGREVG